MIELIKEFFKWIRSLFVWPEIHYDVVFGPEHDGWTYFVFSDENGADLAGKIKIPESWEGAEFKIKWRGVEPKYKKKSEDFIFNKFLTDEKKR